MPKVPPKVLDTAFYLYASKEDAEKGEKFGGTGFLCGIQSKTNSDNHYIYGVTNWHVAIKGGQSVIRLNRRDGGVDVFEFGPEKWEKHPAGIDIAAIKIDI